MQTPGSCPFSWLSALLLCVKEWKVLLKNKTRSWLVPCFTNLEICFLQCLSRMMPSFPIKQVVRTCSPGTMQVAFCKFGASALLLRYSILSNQHSSWPVQVLDPKVALLAPHPHSPVSMMHPAMVLLGDFAILVAASPSLLLLVLEAACWDCRKPGAPNSHSDSCFPLI